MAKIGQKYLPTVSYFTYETSLLDKKCQEFKDQGSGYNFSYGPLARLIRYIFTFLQLVRFLHIYSISVSLRGRNMIDIISTGQNI